MSADQMEIHAMSLKALSDNGNRVRRKPRSLGPLQKSEPSFTSEYLWRKSPSASLKPHFSVWSALLMPQIRQALRLLLRCWHIEGDKLRRTPSCKAKKHQSSVANRCQIGAERLRDSRKASQF